MQDIWHVPKFTEETYELKNVIFGEKEFFFSMETVYCCKSRSVQFFFLFVIFLSVFILFSSCCLRFSFFQQLRSDFRQTPLQQEKLKISKHKNHGIIFFKSWYSTKTNIWYYVLFKCLNIESNFHFWDHPRGGEV